MLKPFFRTLALAAVLLGLFIVPDGQGQGQALAPQTAAVSLVSPAACPSGGCAAGQRLKFKVDFNVSTIGPGFPSNVQVCVFAPIDWSTDRFDFNPQGAISHLTYNKSTSQCLSVPNLYASAGGAITNLPSGAPGDSFEFTFHLGTTATTSGSVLVQIYERDASDHWTQTSQALTAIQVTARTAAVFVANDNLACGSNSPCYINMQDDLADGIGTGLKDAIDSAISPATINILGDYLIKQNAVLLNKPHTIKSGGTNRITYSGAVCNQPMLQITAGASLSGLSIDDGTCSSPGRDLAVILSSDPAVTIENSNLTHGATAIRAAAGNTAAITVRNSNITANTGYAILLDSSNTGILTALTNNLAGNRAGVQVNCNGAAKGKVDHNYWGEGVTASLATSQCTANDAKRLGAPILSNSANPGVQVEQVTVGAAPLYKFNNTIGYQRNSTGTDFGLFIVNHGHDIPANVPFSPSQPGNPEACSNYWDIFLADTNAPVSPTTLELFFKYDLNPVCIANIESVQYCGQSGNPAVYPLLWYDLTTESWKNTGGSGGRTTLCQTSSKEIHLTIDSGSGSPGFTDLARQAFVVGLPGLLSVTPGDRQATVKWVTTNEISLTGFYVQRSTTRDSGYVDVSPLIAHQGSGTGGATYSYTNTGLTNNTTYYYRLNIQGLDGNSVYSASTTAVIPTAATATPTLTPTNTPVPPTLTLTRFPTSTFIFYTATRTRTITPSPTSPFQTVTNTRTSTATSLTSSVTVSPKPAYPVATTLDVSTALADTRAARTLIAQLSATPTPTPEPPPSKNASPLTIVMAVLAVGSLAGGAIYLIREQRLMRP